ncbi:hypothetical protein BVG16_26565 [Paenibacillus selenitireducens]|uniref:Uncharacterized protein n=1 Tax=Paenibacillus selenitireducens TaxID=1324314 RepID=A0A1T2X1R7_9BACL|nr:hypothetical protein [Paenibacillus selenitireducens]OPA73666.1 hypothetical protein BVG16_26565 [Paenibacillus selenitireducens]
MKKFRGVRRHYYKVNNLINSISFHLNETDSWYNFWHVHLEGRGVSNLSVKHRRNHIKLLKKLLERIEDHSKESKLEFQTWILIDSESGTNDSVYMHTLNPHSDFPFFNENILWGANFPELFEGIFDEDEYVIGKTRNEYGNGYIIYKRKLGIPLSNFEEGSDIR